WKLFWHHQLQPQGRTLWYRLILGKLYSNETLSKFGDQASSCNLCFSPNESIQHLFVSCPIKWDIWLRSFALILPSISITPSTMMSFLWNLDFPSDKNVATTVRLLCACIIQAIWQHHWQYIICDTSFNVNIALSTVISLFTQLRPDPLIYLIPP
ncbi:hypothetical protein BC941DRAFT_363075, partial [Chlamydoabsidia padenii]